MSTTNDLDETRLAECPDHDPDRCLFRLSPERFGLGVEVKTVLVDRPDLAETVLADICWHAGVDPARLPLPPTGIDASVGRFSGATAGPRAPSLESASSWKRFVSSSIGWMPAASQTLRNVGQTRR